MDKPKQDPQTLPTSNGPLTHRDRWLYSNPFDTPFDNSPEDESDRLYSEADLRDILNYGR